MTLFLGGGEAIVGEAKRRVQVMIIITHLACCICKAEVACRTRARAADTTVMQQFASNFRQHDSCGEAAGGPRDAQT